MAKWIAWLELAGYSIAIGAFLAAILYTSTAKADEWTKTDYGLYAASTALIVADWGQTRNIAHNPQKYRELNQMLGDHPSVGNVNAYFIGVLGLNTAVAYVLPREYRRIYLGSSIAVRLVVFNHNRQIGLKVDF